MLIRQKAPIVMRCLSSQGIHSRDFILTLQMWDPHLSHFLCSRKTILQQQEMWIIIYGFFSSGWYISRKRELSLKFQTSEAFLNLKYATLFLFPVLQGSSPATGWSNLDPTSVLSETYYKPCGGLSWLDENHLRNVLICHSSQHLGQLQLAW